MGVHNFDETCFSLRMAQEGNTADNRNNQVNYPVYQEIPIFVKRKEKSRHLIYPDGYDNNYQAIIDYFKASIKTLLESKEKS